MNVGVGVGVVVRARVDVLPLRPGPRLPPRSFRNAYARWSARLRKAHLAVAWFLYVVPLLWFCL